VSRKLVGRMAAVVEIPAKLGLVFRDRDDFAAIDRVGDQWRAFQADLPISISIPPSPKRRPTRTPWKRWEVSTHWYPPIKISQQFAGRSKVVGEQGFEEAHSQSLRAGV